MRLIKSPLKVNKIRAKSREGVQRDILPIVEGSQVNTKYGPYKRITFYLSLQVLSTCQNQVT